MRLACARVVAALPESYRASCVDLVETAQAQLREDKDPDVRAVMRGEGEEETVSCDTIIPTFTSLDNVISEVYRDSCEGCGANHFLSSGHRDSRKWAVRNCIVKH